MFEAYEQARYGSKRQLQPAANVYDILPAAFHNAFRNRGYKQQELSESESAQTLATPQHRMLRSLIMSSAGALAAAENAGIVVRNDKNQSMMLDGVTRLQYERFKDSIWKDFETRAAGRPSERIDIYDAAADQAKVISRISSGTAGDRLSVMKRLAAIEEADQTQIWQEASRNAEAKTR